jgi:uncharacterized protein YjiS (DUF1127 family)
MNIKSLTDDVKRSISTRHLEVRATSALTRVFDAYGEPRRTTARLLQHRGRVSFEARRSRGSLLRMTDHDLSREP